MLCCALFSHVERTFFVPETMLQVAEIDRYTEVPPPVTWLSNGMLQLVDQTLLPLRLETITCRSVDALADAIRTLKVRGAPTIGVAAAYGLCLAADLSSATDLPAFLDDLTAAASVLRGTRPTAVNLAWALDTVLTSAQRAHSVSEARETVRATAERIRRENEAANVQMGEYGAQLLQDGMNVLTHCNAGPLAVGGIGSALGIIYTAYKQGKRIHVWVGETRPLLQGARITTWELQRWGIPCTLIADNMAASLMRAGRVDAVLVGADRIAANGDFANKIGTYSLAALAHIHDIPFYVAAPASTVDLSIATGSDIVIEERNADEVSHHAGKRMAPEGTAIYNPAFDVTPGGLVSCIITEAGILRPPYSLSLFKSKQA